MHRGRRFGRNDSIPTCDGVRGRDVERLGTGGNSTDTGQRGRGIAQLLVRTSAEGRGRAVISVAVSDVDTQTNASSNALQKRVLFHCICSGLRNKTYKQEQEPYHPNPTGQTGAAILSLAEPSAARL